MNPAAERVVVLDGVRGIAISLVLYHHFVIYSGMKPESSLDYHLFRLGQSSWVGVDLFFVLSGFLITGILLDAKSSPRYFGNFYGRRALRIFPLYYAFLATVFLLVPPFLDPATGATLTEGQGWYWLYLSNFDVALNGWREPLHLGHFWSLAVEEQFYLVWPLVVYFCSRARLLQVSLLCFASALLLRFVIPEYLDPLANYVLMPARMDAFAAGALVAMLTRSPGGLGALGHGPLAVLAAGTAGLAVTYKLRTGIDTEDPWIYTVGFSVIAITFAALIACSLTSRTGSWVQRGLSSAPLVALGKYSYALYIFHHPISLLLKQAGVSVDIAPRLAGSQAPGLLAFSAIAFSLSLLCAIISWRALETPFLDLKQKYFRQ